MTRCDQHLCKKSSGSSEYPQVPNDDIVIAGSLPRSGPPWRRRSIVSAGQPPDATCHFLPKGVAARDSRLADLEIGSLGSSFRKRLGIARRWGAFAAASFHELAATSATSYWRREILRHSAILTYLKLVQRTFHMCDM